MRSPGNADHPLDEVMAGIRRIAKDDDLAPLGIPEPVGELVDQEALSRVQGGQHRRSVNGKGPRDKDHDENGEERRLHPPSPRTPAREALP